MPRVFAVFIAILICATVARGNVPIIVNTPAHQLEVMKLCSDASDQLRNGDIAGAKRKGFSGTPGLVSTTQTDSGFTIISGKGSHRGERMNRTAVLVVKH